MQKFQWLLFEVRNIVMQNFGGQPVEDGCMTRVASDVFSLHP